MIARIATRNGVHPMAGADGRIGFTARHNSSIDARSQGLLPLTPGLSSVRLLPEEIPAFRASHPNVLLGCFPPLRPQLDLATARSGAPAFRQATTQNGAGVVVGVIDTGVDVSHPDLRDAQGHTRVAWLIDLSKGPTGKHPELESQYGCNDPSLGGCAIFDSADINELLFTLNNGDLIPRDAIGHGTHVASIAAGNGLGSTGDRFAGMAPGASIIAARVTRSDSEDVTDADAILGAKFIFEQAERMGLAAVVNMSLGTDFGAHDGTAPLETGLASFVGPNHPGRAIAVAAGNSGAIYANGADMYGIHTEVRVAPGARTLVPTLSVAMTTNEVKGSVYVWVTWRGADSISVGLNNAKGEAIVPMVKPGSSAGANPKATPALEAAIYVDVFGEASPMTAGSHGAVIWFSGTWPSNENLVLALEGSGTADLWLQGTGQAAISGSGLGQRFLRAVKHGTVNIPATHPMIIGVGATLNRSKWTDQEGADIQVKRFGAQTPPVVDSMAYFSGAGPTATGLGKPDISAPGVFVVAAMSHDADPRQNGLSMFSAPSGLCPAANDECYVVDDRHVIATGTSMATPMVSGAIALLLGLEPSLTQPEVLTLLQAGARWPQGAVPYPFAMGPGALDVNGSRLALEAGRQAIHREPEGAASWVVMSSPYARPEPERTVWGWVELRGNGGLIADGFDTGKLVLEVRGGRVSQGLERLGPGLWRFGVAAEDGSGGGTVHAEVRYDGVLIGREQALPIGPDLFMATEGMRALGGSCGVALGETRGWGAWWAAAWSAMMVGVKRRRGRARRGR